MITPPPSVDGSSPFIKGRLQGCIFYLLEIFSSSLLSPLAKGSTAVRRGGVMAKPSILRTLSLYANSHQLFLPEECTENASCDGPSEL